MKPKNLKKLNKLSIKLFKMQNLGEEIKKP